LGIYDQFVCCSPRVIERSRRILAAKKPLFVSPACETSADRIIRTYSWNASHTPDHSTAPNTPNYPASSLGLTNYLQVNHSNPDLGQVNSHSPATSLAPGPVPIRQQYTYHHTPTSAPTIGDPLRFIDGNPRPAKSPRHVAPPELPSNVPYNEYGTRFAPPYSGPSEAMPARAPEYFPTTMSINAWTSGPEAGVVYGTSSQTPGVHHYEFPNEQYVKEEEAPHPPMHYTWNQS
jgi:hypothetical protein